MRARKRFGQHFLEPAWVTKVVKAVDAKPDENILEIGPGRAAITRPLAEQCGRLLAVEVDRDLAADLNIYGIVSGAVPAPHAPVPDLTVDLTAPARAYDHPRPRTTARPDGRASAADSTAAAPEPNAPKRYRYRY